MAYREPSKPQGYREPAKPEAEKPEPKMDVLVGDFLRHVKYPGQPTVLVEQITEDGRYVILRDSGRRTKVGAKTLQREYAKVTS